ncbi:MAG TPA: hypothetical protein DDZ80_23720 [Cyanobacteria bacterium UBA8803]|nr:hypothetical protein [Cyanobacteria bacterium UBA9273]HBL61329.1 hypothetical protein [Cyanobacteria bacterium UBA8803]
MQQLAKIVILTAKVHPHICGVGDYSINLATYCQTQLNINIDLIVEQGCQASSEPVTILPYVESWSKPGLQKLFTFLDTQNVETVILQYTPWLYSPKGFVPDLLDFWKQCTKRFQTLLIAHETYSWFLKYPGTWLLGILQQYVLRELVRSSDRVFSGSEPYLHRLKRFSNHPERIHYLPIPNNILFQRLTRTHKQELRQKLAILPEHMVLTLFGCIGSIWQPWISALDSCLLQNKYPVVWLLLGNAQSLSLPFQNPVIRPGYLSQTEFSHYLQLSSLMLMPHEFGISAKRTSLMSALEHGIPVIGTDGMLTDSFFRKLPSIVLSPDHNYSKFEQQILNSLTQLPSLHQLAQRTQDYYKQHLSWSVVTQTLLPYLQNCSPC